MCGGGRDTVAGLRHQRRHDAHSFHTTLEAKRLVQRRYSRLKRLGLVGGRNEMSILKNEVSRHACVDYDTI